MNQTEIKKEVSRIANFLIVAVVLILAGGFIAGISSLQISLLFHNKIEISDFIVIVDIFGIFFMAVGCLILYIGFDEGLHFLKSKKEE